MVLTANKILTGKNLNANDFEFVLKDKDNNVLQTKKNDAQGAINFDAISYDQAGTYTYTIEEVVGSQTGMTYDKHVIDVTVTVEDQDGQLVATASYTGDQTFTNVYTPKRKTPNRDDTDKTLPKTGEKELRILSQLGVLLLLFCIFLSYILKRKHI